MPAPKINVVKVQTDDRNTNQLQDNIIAAIMQLQQQITGAGAIGEVRAAYCTEAQFQQQMGAGWVLSDGRSVKGSQYEAFGLGSTLPDARGTVLRMQSGTSSRNPAGNLPLGTYQADTTAKNGLALTDPGHSHFVSDATYTSGTPSQVRTAAGQPEGANSWLTNTGLTGITLGAGDSETGAKATTANLFVRIN